MSRLDAAVLLAGFAGFLYYVARMMRRERAVEGQNSTPERGIPVSCVMMAVGFCGLFFGGKLAVNQAVEIARLLGVEERIIALTIVAFGTSLPELATSAVAAWRGNADIAVGNVVGSNLFNLLLVFGVSGLVRPLPYSPAYDADLAVMVGSMILLFTFMFTGKVHKLDRWEAVLFLTMYAGYTSMLIVL
jgi:cation:H+ antiporter